MNPLLLLIGGGVAGYLLLQRRTAEAAAPSPPASPGGTPPMPTQSPVVVTGGAPNLPPPSMPSHLTTNVPRPANPWEPTVNGRPPSTKLLQPLPGRWVWPVPRWDGRAPVISDGFGSPRPGTIHAGVDVMFARVANDPFSVGSPNGSKLYVMPDAWMALAASDGVLWSAGHTARGYAVVIDHGQAATFYTHLDTLFVPLATPHAKGTNPAHLVHVQAGQPLGVIGADPQDAARLKHLHFEVWLGGPDAAIDPKPIMNTWHVPTANDVYPFLSALTRNAKRKYPEGEHPEFVKVAGYERRWPRTALNWSE